MITDGRRIDRCTVGRSSVAADAPYPSSLNSLFQAHLFIDFLGLTTGEPGLV
jgi:hypothetical protein